MKVYESTSGVIKLNKKSSMAKLETKSSVPKLERKPSIPKLESKRNRKKSMLITPVSYPEPLKKAGPFRRDRDGPVSQSVDFATIQYPPFARKESSLITLSSMDDQKLL